MPKSIIIFGSARKNGNTRKLVDHIRSIADIDLIDLNDYQMSYYDYEHRNQGDDFFPLMEHLLTYDIWVFATPVYWYSMSAVMKNFFDRMTDLLDIHLDMKEQLKQTAIMLVCCGSDSEPIPGFALPFSETADYLGMQYLGDMHGWVENGEISGEVSQIAARFLGNIHAHEN